MLVMIFVLLRVTPRVWFTTSFYQGAERVKYYLFFRVEPKDLPKLVLPRPEVLLHLFGHHRVHRTCNDDLLKGYQKCGFVCF
jgi:hypothetical protein